MLLIQFLNIYMQLQGMELLEQEQLLIVILFKGIYLLDYTEVYLDQSVSVAEFTATEVSVYPNPATDQVSFVSEDSNPISTILFYSLEGKVVRTESNINATNIVVSNLDLPKGIYFANVRFKEGTTVKKIVIQ